MSTTPTPQQIEIVSDLVGYAEADCPFVEGSDDYNTFMSYLDNCMESDSILHYINSDVASIVSAASDF